MRVCGLVRAAPELAEAGLDCFWREPNLERNLLRVQHESLREQKQSENVEEEEIGERFGPLSGFVGKGGFEVVLERCGEVEFLLPSFRARVEEAEEHVRECGCFGAALAESRLLRERSARVADELRELLLLSLCRRRRRCRGPLGRRELLPRERAEDGRRRELLERVSGVGGGGVGVVRGKEARLRSHRVALRGRRLVRHRRLQSRLEPLRANRLHPELALRLLRRRALPLLAPERRYQSRVIRANLFQSRRRRSRHGCTVVERMGARVESDNALRAVLHQRHRPRVPVHQRRSVQARRRTLCLAQNVVPHVINSFSAGDEDHLLLGLRRRRLRVCSRVRLE
mmetsp:Transcript_26733/g.87683  ORF Transcript_26733/g.87683 Transcript_26733/m.87683 type:complete len:342 (-) Transcript_26733:177-1202(-)